MFASIVLLTQMMKAIPQNNTIILELFHQTVPKKLSTNSAKKMNKIVQALFLQLSTFSAITLVMRMMKAKHNTNDIILKVVYYL